MERRRQERYVLDAPIMVSSLGNRVSAPYRATSRDISSTGVFVKTTNARFKTSQRVHLEMLLKIEKTRELFGGSGLVKLEVDGSIVRSIRSGFVVEFEKSYSISPA